MEVGESIDISDLPGRIVHCSVRCRRNVTKYTGSFKFTNVNHREDVFYCFPGSGEGGRWYFKKAKFTDSERVFPRLSKAFHI